MRGYETASIGPKDAQGNALGGNVQLVGNAEYYFPFPGLQKDKSVRLSAFVDAGTLGDTSRRCAAGVAARLQARLGGLALSWFSPVGPLKISYAFALEPGAGRPDPAVPVLAGYDVLITGGAIRTIIARLGGP